MSVSRYIGMAGHTVEVETDGGAARWPLRHRVRHSPTGFSWGYHGSGPSDLALSLLWDYMDTEPAPALYQAFKVAFIAPLPMDADWVIEGEDIRRWLLNYARSQEVTS